MGERGDPIEGGPQMATVSVRYIVNDVDEAISFYCQQLGFDEVMHPAPTFAMETPCVPTLLPCPTVDPPPGKAARPA